MGYRFSALPYSNFRNCYSPRPVLFMLRYLCGGEGGPTAHRRSFRRCASTVHRNSHHVRNSNLKRAADVRGARPACCPFDVWIFLAMPLTMLDQPHGKLSHLAFVRRRSPRRLAEDTRGETLCHDRTTPSGLGTPFLTSSRVLFGAEA